MILNKYIHYFTMLSFLNLKVIGQTSLESTNINLLHTNNWNCAIIQRNFGVYFEDYFHKKSNKIYQFSYLINANIGIGLNQFANSMQIINSPTHLHASIRIGTRLNFHRYLNWIEFWPYRLSYYSLHYKSIDKKPINTFSRYSLGIGIHISDQFIIRYFHEYNNLDKFPVGYKLNPNIFELIIKQGFSSVKTEIFLSLGLCMSYTKIPNINNISNSKNIIGDLILQFMLPNKFFTNLIISKNRAFKIYDTNLLNDNLKDTLSVNNDVSLIYNIGHTFNKCLLNSSVQIGSGYINQLITDSKYKKERLTKRIVYSFRYNIPITCKKREDNLLSLYYSISYSPGYIFEYESNSGKTKFKEFNLKSHTLGLSCRLR